MRARLAALAALFLAQSPASADRKPEFARPTYAGAYEPQGIDERGLWMEVDEAERALRDSPFVLHDARLTGYVHDILCRTVGTDRCAAARIYIVMDQGFNASMAPNGLTIVQTGLLARMHSEAELASILGHEFAHFELRHSLKGFRNQRTSTDLLAWLGLAGVLTRQDFSASRNAIVVGFYAFSRAQEKEADLLGAQFVRASLYPLQASAVWKRLIEEEDALRAERKLRKIRHSEPNLTDTHPTEQQRMTYLAALEAETDARDGDDGEQAYRAETDRVLPVLFESLVKGNEFGAADYVIRSRGDAMGWDPALLCLRGELYRMRGNPRDFVTAHGLFEQGAALDGAPPQCWRGVGLTAIRTGEVEAGRTALRTYLNMTPAAADAAAMKLLLEK